MKELKLMRNKVGLTQTEVCKKMGWQSGQYLSNIERGLCLPPRSKIKALAKLYRVSPDDIAGLFVKDYIVKLNKYC